MPLVKHNEIQYLESYSVHDKQVFLDYEIMEDILYGYMTQAILKEERTKVLREHVISSIKERREEGDEHKRGLKDKHSSTIAYERVKWYIRWNDIQVSSIHIDII